MNKNKIILWVTTIILSIIEIYSLSLDSHYKWDFIFLMGLLWGTYFLRKPLKLHHTHFFLLGVFLIMHNLGVFNAYDYLYWGIEYDFFVHTLFGLVAGLILFRYFHFVGPYNGWAKIAAVIIIVLGLSAFHELFEFTGALIFGKGEGVLFLGAGDLDQWDTQKDMFNGLLGSIIAIIMYNIFHKLYKKK